MQAWVIEKIVKKLSDKEYDVALFTRNCFDIVARKKDSTLLIKVLLNVDSYHQDQANDLKKMAEVFQASPLIIGFRGRNFALRDNSVYERFGVPVVNPETFCRAFDDNVSFVISKKGSNMVRFDREQLRKLRNRDELSLQKFSEKVGVSKKTIYLAEREGRVGEDILNAIEDFFGASLRRNFDIFDWDIDVDLKSDLKGSIEKRIVVNTKRVGFTNFIFERAPANLVLRDSAEMVLLDVMDRLVTRKHAEDLRKFGDVMEEPRAFVLEGHRIVSRKNIDGVAVISSEEITHVQSKKEMLDLIDERED